MTLAAAFADPVHESQATFRAVMDAMARPGTIHRLAGLAGAPAPLSPVAAAVALTLADFETPLFLDAPLARVADIGRWLAFHSGAPIVREASLVAFALIADPLAIPDFVAFAAGTDIYPDRSTTLIVQVEALESGTVGQPTQTLLLDGPGIRDTTAISVSGLPADIVGRLAANRALFPRGVDLVLAAPEAIAALPRSTRVRAPSQGA
ncbi:phosphonate C-P lyase system protein PhnH [Phreatobacter sp.]|uniref:phosphonate C-P lyase system protein PhnH n=1 Tax=Phreatobacter sp. TaxID=1966341 RepID=UPI003F6F611B